MRPHPATEKETGQNLAWGWRLLLGLGVTAAIILVAALPMLRMQSASMIELGLLDRTGGTRGADTNEVALLQGMWKGRPVQTISSEGELASWEKNWPANRRWSAKVIYDPAAAEVRVAGRSRMGFFQKAFPVEKDLGATLQQINAFILQQGL